jgi:hypothetical protein
MRMRSCRVRLKVVDTTASTSGFARCVWTFRARAGSDLVVDSGCDVATLFTESMHGKRSVQAPTDPVPTQRLVLTPGGRDVDDPNL